eukprot:Colp12_sorted_trinity150504_noHs@2103
MLSRQSSRNGSIVEDVAPVPLANKTRRRFLVHQVSVTDTFNSLSLQYGVSVGDIKRSNNLWNERDIFARQTLNIPVHEKGSSTENGSSEQIFSHSSSTSSLRSLNSKKSEVSVDDLFAKVDQALDLGKKYTSEADVLETKRLSEEVERSNSRRRSEEVVSMQNGKLDKNFRLRASTSADSGKPRKLSSLLAERPLPEIRAVHERVDEDLFAL